MSRGRHRHSSLLGRSVPPVATGVLIVAAVAALVASPDPIVARSVGIAAVCAAVGLGVLLRQRDRAARTAAQLALVRRLRAEERFEEQLAEAEYAAEVADERATRFGRRLTAEKSRLAKAETEIARLLRERAVMVAEQALKDAEAARRAIEAARPKYPASPAAFVRAAAAMRHLERQASMAEARRATDERAQVAIRPKPPQLVPAGPLPASQRPGAARTDAAPPAEGERPAVAAAPERRELPGLAEPRPGAPATAIVPAERQRPRASGSGAARGFSFFGRHGAARAALRAAAPAPSVGDLADVVGDEALAASARYAAQEARQAEAEQTDVAPAHSHPEVVDLTAHDETELLELPELRAGRS